MSREVAAEGWELRVTPSIAKPVRGRHWGAYARGTYFDRYRYCYACKSWRRNTMLRDSKPLIHKGGKP